MTLANLVLLVLKASIALTVFGLGLRASTSDTSYLFRRPGLLIRALLSMNVAMPILAWVLATAFDLRPAVKIALVALSVSPVPPILPKKQLKAGVSVHYALGLLVASALLAVITVPLALRLVEKVSDQPVAMSFGAIAMVAFQTVLAPFLAGMAVRAFAPGLAADAVHPVGVISTAMLALGAVPLLLTSLPAIWSLVGNGTLLALTVFAIGGIVAGHILGPDSEDRIGLALSTASRHPGMAVAIAHASFPDQKLAVPAVLLYVIVSGIVSAIYLKWMTAHPATGAHLPVTGRV